MCLLPFSLLLHSPFTTEVFFLAQLLKLFALRIENKVLFISRFQMPTNQLQAVVPSHPTPPNPTQAVPI